MARHSVSRHHRRMSYLVVDIEGVRYLAALVEDGWRLIGPDGQTVSIKLEELAKLVAPTPTPSVH